MNRLTKGWGRKLSGKKLVFISKIIQGEFVLLEDGFIRSIGLGGSKSFSIVEDDIGIYYDATTLCKLENLLNNYDFILTPTTPHTAFDLGLEVKNPVAMYLEDIYTVLANLCGNPAISLPLAEHTNGMPFGTQLMAKPFHESELLGFSHNLMNSL